MAVLFHPQAWWWRPAADAGLVGTAAASNTAPNASARSFIVFPPVGGGAFDETILNDYTARVKLLRGDAGGIDHLAPVRFVVGEEFGKLARRHRRRHAAVVLEARENLGIGDGIFQRGVERRDDLGRRVARREQGVPDVDLVA